MMLEYFASNIGEKEIECCIVVIFHYRFVWMKGGTFGLLRLFCILNNSSFFRGRKYS